MRASIVPLRFAWPRPVVAAVAAVLGSAVALGQTVVTWNGGSGSWQTAALWAGATVPTPADTAAVAAGSVTIDAATTIAALTFSGGTIGGSSTLTLSGTGSTWTGGGLAGAGSLLVGPTGSLALAGPSAKDLYHGSNGAGGRVLDNHGTVTWNGDGALRLGDGAQIVNRAGATFTAGSNAALVYIGFGTGGSFTNLGTFVKSGATGTTTLAQPFVNVGLVDTRAGTVAFTAATSGSGEFRAAADTANRFSGGAAFTDGARFTGAGVNELAAGHTSFAGSIGSANLVFSAGTFSGSAALSGDVRWTGGSFVGGNELSFRSGTFSIDGSATRALYHGANGSGGAILRFESLARWTGTGSILGGDGAGLRIASGGTLELHSDATFGYIGFGQGPFIENAGTLRKGPLPVTGPAVAAAPGTSTISGTAVTNSGLIDVQAGTLLLSGSSLQSSGNVTVASGAALVLAAGGGSVGGASGRFTLATGGTLRLEGGIFATSGAKFVGGGLTEIAGGTLAVGGDTAVGDATAAGRLKLSSGAIGGSGQLAVRPGGQFTWSGGSLLGTTVFEIESGASALIEGAADKTLAHGANGSGGHTFANSGSLVWSGTGNLLLGDGAAVRNDEGGFFEIRGDAEFRYVGYGNAGALTNSGLLRKSAGTLTTFRQPVFNPKGTLEATAGTLALAGGGSSSGTLRATGTGLIAITQPYTLTGGAILGSGGVRITSDLAVNGPTAVGNATQTGRLALAPGGSLGGGAPLTVGDDSRFDWTGGRQLGTGSTVITAGGILALNGPDAKTLAHGNNGSGGRTVENFGTVTVNGTGALLGGDGATILNRETGVIVLGSDTSAGYVGHGNGPVLQNAGSLVKNGSDGTFTFAGFPVNNTGLVQVAQGTLALNAGGTSNGGTFDLAVDTVLRFGSAYSFTASSLAGDGRFEVAGAVLTFLGSGNQLEGTLALPAGGTLSGSGTLAVTGSLEWLGGSMIQSGITRIDSPGTLLLSGDDAKFLFHGNNGSGGRTVDNAGLLALSGRGDLKFGDGAALLNRAEGIVDLRSDAGLAYAGFGNGGFVDNAGLFQKSAGTFTSVGGVAFVNQSTGEVAARSGALVFDDTFTNRGGLIHADRGALVRFGGGTTTRTFEAGTRFGGFGETQIVAGTTVLNGAFTASNLVVAAGTLAGEAPVLHGSMAWTGGRWIGTGQFTVAGDAVLVLDGPENKLLQHGSNGSGGRQLVNEGQLVFQGTGSLLFGDGAGLLNRNGGLLVLKSDATVGYAGFGNGGSFTNDGTLLKAAGTGTSTISIPVVNTGTIAVNSGTLALTGGFTNHRGNIVLTGGNLSVAGTLDLGTAALAGSGTITASQVNAAGIVAPGNSPGTLTLTGNLTLASTSALIIELGGRERGSTYDFLSVGGAAALAGSLNLTFTAGFESSVTPADTFTILSAANVSGVFANASANPARLVTTDGLGSFLVGYTGTGVTLSQFVPVPEPSTWALLITGAAAVLLATLRRRR